MTTVQKIISKNTEDYDYLKLAEECSELSEVLIKSITKSNRREEFIPHLIEELGDVKMRINILVERLAVHENVNDRIRSKLEYLEEKIKEDKYKNY